MHATHPRYLNLAVHEVTQVLLCLQVRRRRHKIIRSFDQEDLQEGQKYAFVGFQQAAQVVSAEEEFC
jgi:hypothetical protein